MKALRQPTLSTLALGNVIDIFKNGKLPVTTSELVDKVFGDKNNRGALVISGANGIVGAGKTMQLGSRLLDYGIPIVALDFPGASDGIGQQYQGLRASFGQKQADKIMTSVIKLNYDGKTLPKILNELNPKFLLEAIPEILEIKKSHYRVFRETFPGIEIRSVTSGFPRSELGVSIAHPAFPHQINKMWEIVEAEVSPITQLLWSLGLIPVPVSDHWSFVLDVLFCGLTLAGLRYRRASNMPYWKIDKFVRKMIGPNPFRAHDAIGAAGANFLTWSCLHHLSYKYGDLFTPTPELEYRKESGQNWYPLNHFRPVVNWNLSDDEQKEMENWILGPLIQMTSLLLKENRGHFTHINMIGEICAQFRNGVLALIRKLGSDKALSIVSDYHKLHPEAAKDTWYPEVFDNMDTPEWQQLYVNAEHDGIVGVISICRERYNRDIDIELNRAIDWLKSENIDSVILTGDFHLATQLVGADISEFYPALEDSDKGYEISFDWSKTARRFNSEFKTSVGFINGKRCLGGMLELMMHCHYLVATKDCKVGMPEVTLPVVPGMEGCHWMFRKVDKSNWPKVFEMLITGKALNASDATGWLVDFSGSLEEALQVVWKIVSNGDYKIKKQEIDSGVITGLENYIKTYGSENPLTIAGSKAIIDCAINSCSVNLDESIVVQAKHSASFMGSNECRKGLIGSEAAKVINV